MPAFYSRAYTMSDDDVQPPPQQLQRSVVQLQAAQQQQQQQQGARQQQQQSPVPVEVFGPWSAPAAARLTGQSSVSSVGSDRLALEQYSVAGAAPGPGSSLGPSPQPPSLLQQAVLSAAGALDEGPAAQSRASPSQAGSQQQQSGRGTPWTSGGGGGGGLGASQAATAAAAIAAAGAATAASGSGASGTPGWSSTGGASAAAAAVNTGTGPGSGHGGAGSSAAGGAGGAAAVAHPQLLAMVNHPWAGSGPGARNWELFSGAAELEEQLGKVSERMQEMGFSEQRIKVGFGQGSAWRFWGSEGGLVGAPCASRAVTSFFSSRKQLLATDPVLTSAAPQNRPPCCPVLSCPAVLPTPRTLLSWLG